MPVKSFSLPDFFKNFEATLKDLFHSQFDIDILSNQRGLPPEIIKGIMDTGPLAIAIPEVYGGKGSSMKEILAFLEIASFESLPLSLLFGINIGLFLYPISKYAHQDIKTNIFERFIHHRNMGGLMITEPGYGSDALSMRTCHTLSDNGYALKGTKHWQGLTGMADYWLIAARKNLGDVTLGRDIDLFVSDAMIDEQKVQVLEFYDAAGLYMIPYGKNKIDITVPVQSKLQPHSTGIKMLLDILHRSRMQFPGMGMGFIKRMLKEAIKHCKTRMVGAGNLLSMDNIKYQLARIQAAYTVCSAMCAKSSSISGLEHDLSGAGLEANTIKAYVTDLMHESSQILVQVSGSGGYRQSNIGGRGIMDSRPFQIFEGSNEMLYIQIAEIVGKQMKQAKQMNLFAHLRNFSLTAAACTLFKKELSFTLSSVLPQRKMLELGKAISRIISLEYVIALGNGGFRAELIGNCIDIVKREVCGILHTFHSPSMTGIIEDFEKDSAWVDFA